MTPFAASETRRKLLEDMRGVLDGLESAGVAGKIWLDGSFTAEKVNPSDIDFILVVDADFYDGGTADQQRAIDELVEEPVCDTNVMFLFSAGISDNVQQIGYWTDRLGTSIAGRVAKGIVVIELKGGDDNDDGIDGRGSSEDSAR